MNELSPEQQAIQIVSTWKAIDEPQRTDSLLRYYIALAIKDATCTSDHCTPEERAVIEASLARREAEKAMFPFSTAPSLSFRQDSDEGHVLLSAFTAEQHACDALLAARTGREE